MNIGSARRSRGHRVVLVSKTCPDKGHGKAFKERTGISKRKARLLRKHGLIVEPAEGFIVYRTGAYAGIRKKRKQAEHLVRAKKHLMAKAERVGKVRTKRTKVSNVDTGKKRK